MSFMTSITQSGYVRQNQPNGYLKKSLPPLELEYSKVPDFSQLSQLPVQMVDEESLENVPYGVDGSKYTWVDLDGEGLTGIFTAQGGGWFYKRNLSANHQVSDNGSERTVAKFGPLELIMTQPSVVAGQPQFMDLAGDGQLDLVQMEGPLRGFSKRTDHARWLPFRAFVSWPNVDIHDPNLRFVDLNGDGFADILILEDEVFRWYPSLAEDGFGPAKLVPQEVDEEKCPRLVFADSTQSIYLADFSGDGLNDLVRIRNGDICYWPNLGYGHFGARVAMDNAPWFDYSDQFNQQRIRIADIDGSGTVDILYFGSDTVDIYRNQAGNGWSQAERLTAVPQIDQLTTVVAVDLLGNGTACLVWSTSRPTDASISALS